MDHRTCGMWRKRLLLAGLVCALTAALFAGCGEKGAASARTAQQTAEAFADAWAEMDLLGCDEYLAYSVPDVMLKIYRENGDFGKVTDSQVQRENTQRRIEDLHARTRQILTEQFGGDYEIRSETLTVYEVPEDELRDTLGYYQDSKLAAEICLPEWVDFSAVRGMQILRVQTTVSGRGKTNTRENMICLALIDGQWYVLW